MKQKYKITLTSTLAKMANTLTNKNDKHKMTTQVDKQIDKHNDNKKTDIKQIDKHMSKKLDETDKKTLAGNKTMAKRK